MLTFTSWLENNFAQVQIWEEIEFVALIPKIGCHVTSEHTKNY